MGSVCGTVYKYFDPSLIVCRTLSRERKGRLTEYSWTKVKRGVNKTEFLVSKLGR